MNGDEAVGYAKLGPPSLPFEPTGTPIELRQFYLRKAAQGTGLAATLMLEGTHAVLPRWELGLLKDTLVRELARAE